MAEADPAQSLDRVVDRINTNPRFTVADAITLNRMFRASDAGEVLQAVLKDGIAGDVAMVSSFGAESAVLLHQVAQVNADIPVLFLDTGKHFPETLAYRDMIAERLGLTNVQILYPDLDQLKAKDDTGLRWSYDPDGCCEIRKVAPLAEALAGFDASLTGRKAFQSSTRAELPRFEVDKSDSRGRLKVNPLIDWNSAALQAYLDEHSLPRHPLIAAGYPSIGCSLCTSKVVPGEDPRSGRWKGWDKTECGIHAPVDGARDAKDDDLPPGYEPAF